MPPRRTSRTLAYLALAVAGAAAIAWPPPTVSHAATGPLAYVWAGFLTVGGLAAAVGSATDLWLGEYIGLWPLIVSFGVFGVSAAATGHLIAVAGAATLIAFALWTFARWRDVATLRREATRLAREQQQM